MMYVVQNKITKKEYTIDENVYKTLDMKRKFTLIHSYDEKARQKLVIPEEIISKQMNAGKKERIKKPDEILNQTEDND